jgi:chromosome segregation ATPase
MSQIVEELSKQDAGRSEGSARASALVVSVDEFAALEERVVRAIQLVKQERQARTAAESAAAQAEARAAQAEARATQAESHASDKASHAAQLESELREKEPLHDALQAEIKTLKAERDHVRERVERLLGQLDALEL